MDAKPHVTFRWARPEEAAAIEALIELAYRGATAARGWTNEAALLTGPRTRPGEVAELIAAPGGGFVLAHVAERLAGCALLRQEGGAAYFGMFAVAPEQQAGGLGRALLAECERRARDEWAVSRIWLSVISLREDLIAWYVRRGYRRTDQTIPFPFSDWTGETRRDFHLSVLDKALNEAPAAQG